jgi:hypothetical protein
MAGLQVRETFRDAFTQNDLMSKATYSVVAGETVRLGAYVVKAGEVVSMGCGRSDGQENATGRIYALIKNATVELTGKLRISVYSPQDRPITILGEYRTNILSANATDRTKQLPFPESPVWVQEDQKIVLEFTPDVTDAALTKAQCVLLFDITRGVV